MGFISYSPAVDPTVINASNYLALTYLLMVVSTLVLIHSFYLHGRKYGSIRISTDLAASAGLFSGAFLLIYNQNPNLASTAVTYNFFYNGVLTAIIQLSDNYMFYTRLKAVSKVPRWKRIAINLFIWLVLTATWLPYYTVLAFFYDCNSVEAVYVYSVTLQIEAWSVVTYNFYFTLEFSNILYLTFFAVRNTDNNINNNSNNHNQQNNAGRRSSSSLSWRPGLDLVVSGNRRSGLIVPDSDHSRNSSQSGGSHPHPHQIWHPTAVATLTKTKIIAAKSIGHCITSSLAALIYTYVNGIGFPIYDIIYILGMHFWFNWSLEKYLSCKCKYGGGKTMPAVEPLPENAILSPQQQQQQHLQSDMELYETNAEKPVSGTMTGGVGGINVLSTTPGGGGNVVTGTAAAVQKTRSAASSLLLELPLKTKSVVVVSAGCGTNRSTTAQHQQYGSPRNEMALQARYPGYDVAPPPTSRREE